MSDLLREIYDEFVCVFVRGKAVNRKNESRGYKFWRWFPDDCFVLSQI